MTKSWEKGASEIADEANREAARTGRHVDAILKDMLGAAKRDRDTVRRMKIIQAQKFFGSRNKQKRGRR